MALEIKKQTDPDFPNRTAYRVDCPKCGKFFIASSEKAARSYYLNHRQIHNGEGTDSD